MTYHHLFGSLVALGFLSASALGQSVAQSSGETRPGTIHDVGRGIALGHIGAPPPADASPGRLARWQREKANFDTVLAAINRSWTGEPISNPENLAFQMKQYSDLIKTLAEAGGYGNLLLADAAKRLRAILFIRFLVAHPDQYAQVADLPGSNRTDLLTNRAMDDMLREELGLEPPVGGWRLSEDLDQLERVSGRAMREISGLSSRSILGQQAPGLMVKADVHSLIGRMKADEILEQIVEPGFVEFLKRGGSFSEPQHFAEIMDKPDVKARLNVPALGNVMTILDYIPGAVAYAKRLQGKPMPITEVIGDQKQ